METRSKQRTLEEVSSTVRSTALCGVHRAGVPVHAYREPRAASKDMAWLPQSAGPANICMLILMIWCILGCSCVLFRYHPKAGCGYLGSPFCKGPSSGVVESPQLCGRHVPNRIPGRYLKLLPRRDVALEAVGVRVGSATCTDRCCGRAGPSIHPLADFSSSKTAQGSSVAAGALGVMWLSAERNSFVLSQWRSAP